MTEVLETHNAGGQVDDGTLFICEFVLGQYLKVLSEHPRSMPAQFRHLVLEAALDVERERKRMFLGYRAMPEDAATEAHPA